MKALRVEFDMTREDLFALGLAAAERDPVIRREIWRARWTRAVIILLLVIAEVGATILLGYLDMVGLVAGVVAVAFLVWEWPGRRYLRRTTEKQIAAQLHTPAGRACLGRFVIEASAGGLGAAREYSTGLIYWKGVFDLITTPDHLFVVVPGPSYLIVPRRAFAHDDDFAEFARSVTAWAESAGGLAARRPQDE